MANDLNQCNFIGRLGRDPEQRSMPDGVVVVNMALAVGWKGKSSEGTEWVRLVAFGRLAEVCAQYLTKGSRIFVSGSFNTRSWDKDGQKHYATEIRMNNMQMLDTRQQSSNQGGGQTDDSARGNAPQSSIDDGQSGMDFDDDIPF